MVNIFQSSTLIPLSLFLSRIHTFLIRNSNDDFLYFRCHEEIEGILKSNDVFAALGQSFLDSQCVLFLSLTSSEGLLPLNVLFNDVTCIGYLVVFMNHKLFINDASDWLESLERVNENLTVLFPFRFSQDVNHCFWCCCYNSAQRLCICISLVT